MKKNKRVLVVVAHPDDEILGLGGTILKHVKNGSEVSILILGDGETSRDRGADIEKRENLAKEVAQKMRTSNLFLEKFIDNQFDTLPLLSIVKTVEKYINQVQPEIIYTHHGHDLNIDHRIAFQAVLTAARPMEENSVKKILTFETVSTTEWQAPEKEYIFSPNEYQDISEFIDEKVDLLKVYDDEMRPFPHPRSYEGIKILAKKRGMEVGFKYAEAFRIIRNLVD